MCVCQGYFDVFIEKIRTLKAKIRVRLPVSLPILLLSDFPICGQSGLRMLQTFESFASGLLIDAPNTPGIPYCRSGASLAGKELPQA